MQSLVTTPAPRRFVPRHTHDSDGRRIIGFKSYHTRSLDAGTITRTLRVRFARSRVTLQRGDKLSIRYAGHARAAVVTSFETTKAAFLTKRDLNDSDLRAFSVDAALQQLADLHNIEVTDDTLIDIITWQFENEDSYLDTEDPSAW